MTVKPFFQESHLAKTLSDLVITFAKRENGESFFAYSDSEPFFCIEQNTEEKVKDAVREIIVLYAKLHGVNAKPADLVLSEREKVSTNIRGPKYLPPVEEKVKLIRQFVSPLLSPKKREREAIA